MVFFSKIYADLLWEKIIPCIKKNIFTFETKGGTGGSLQNIWYDLEQFIRGSIFEKEYFLPV